MNPIDDKLNTLANSKANIKAMLMKKGIEVNDIFSSYSNKISRLPNRGKSRPQYVNFYDYEGTLLYRYSLDEIQTLSKLPTLPSHEGLIGEGWNWSLEDIKSLNAPVDVGATYITDDGKTRLYIKIDSDNLALPIYISQTVANGVTIDWGDGSDTETIDTIGTKYISHTYATIGDYIITFDPIDDCILELGNNNSSNPVIPTSALAYRILQKVELGKNVISLTAGMFSGCQSLTSISIPSKVTSLGSYAFQSCYKLSFITIPHGVTNTGYRPFRYCYNAFAISLPNSITTIGDGLYSECNQHISITIPSSVTTISSWAFSGSSLTSITIPDGITYIGSYTFNSCYLLESVDIPSTVTSISNAAFRNCHSLTSIILPDSITTIDSNVFSDCTSLISINIPSSVTTIGNYLFNNCHSLTSITIPEGVTTIGNSAFYGCSSLSSITIPSTVTTINSQAFYNCTSMAVYDFSNHTSVPTLSYTNAFNNIPTDCIIRVPNSLLSEWKVATNWSTYASRMVGV